MAEDALLEGLRGHSLCSGRVPLKDLLGPGGGKKELIMHQFDLCADTVVVVDLLLRPRGIVEASVAARRSDRDDVVGGRLLEAVVACDNVVGHLAPCRKIRREGDVVVLREHDMG